MSMKADFSTWGEEGAEKLVVIRQLQIYSVCSEYACCVWCVYAVYVQCVLCVCVYECVCIQCVNAYAYCVYLCAVCA